MIKLNEINATLFASRTWIFYHNPSSKQDEYVEEQFLDYKDGKPFVTHVQPLTEESLQNIKLLSVKETQNVCKFKGLIPPGVLHLDSSSIKTRIVWICPGIKRKLFFLKGLNIPNGFRMIPNLIFDHSNEDTNVYALPNKFERSNEQKLYYAPFGNISDDGDLCWGTAMKRKLDFEYLDELMEKVENAFFNSNFTHAGTSKQIFGKNISNYWRDALITDKKTITEFNDKLLIENGKTIEDILG